MRGARGAAATDSAGYALGWRVYDYAGNDVVFHAGAVQGYRGADRAAARRDLGVAMLWNSESALPSGLLPTILDRAIGLPTQRWLDVDTDFGSDNLMAEMPHRRGGTLYRAVASSLSPREDAGGRRRVRGHRLAALMIRFA
jgi:beta-lactamase class C